MRGLRDSVRAAMAAIMLVAGVAVVGVATSSPAEAAAGQDLVPLTPARLLDTRDGDRPAAESVTELEVAGRAGVPGNAESVVVNVTAVLPDSAGYLTVFPCGDSRPTASNVNFGADVVVANSAFARLSNDGNLCIYSHAATDLVVDVHAYAAGGSKQVAMTPSRLLDSRTEGVRPAAGAIVELQVAGRADVPADATAAALNVTAVDPGGPGFVTVYPCGTARSTASSLNYVGGPVIPNATMTTLGADGKVCLYTRADTDLVVDVTGYTDDGATLLPVQPARFLESRVGEQFTTADDQFEWAGRLLPDTTLEFDVAGRWFLPTQATGAVVNVTAIGDDATIPGYLTLYPCGQERPVASNVNYAVGQIVSNMAVTKVGSDGKVCVYNSGNVDVAIDVTGVLLPTSSPSTELGVRTIAEQYTAGDGHACQVLANHTVDCWGYDTAGEASPPAGTFGSLTAGGDHTCGIRTDSTVDCWGSNDAGQSNDPSGTFAQVAAAGDSTCGLRTPGFTVDCWGDVADAADPPNERFTQIAVSNSFACGLTGEGRYHCWGDGANEWRYTTDTANFVNLSVTELGGKASLCGLRTDGTADCWGDNDNIELDGTYQQVELYAENRPCTLDMGTDFSCPQDLFAAQATSMSVGTSGDTCVTLTNGDLRCGFGDGPVSWMPNVESVSVGADDQGFGAGATACTIQTDNTVRCGGFRTADDPAGEWQFYKVGEDFECGLRPDGRAICSAEGQDEQVGGGEFSQIDVGHVAIDATEKLSGNTVMCGIITDAALECWWRDRPDFKQLPVPEGQYTAIDAGYDQICAIGTDTTTVCWDYAPEATIENQQPLLEQFESIDVGRTDTCGVTTESTISCFPHADTAPSLVAPDGPFESVVTGNGYACALDADGNAECWGEVSDTNRSGFVQLIADAEGPCGQRTDDTYICW